MRPTNGPERVVGEAAVAEYRATRRRIVAALASAPKGMTGLELVEAVGTSAVSQALLDLIGEGAVGKVVRARPAAGGRSVPVRVYLRCVRVAAGPGEGGGS